MSDIGIIMLTAFCTLAASLVIGVIAYRNYDSHRNSNAHTARSFDELLREHPELNCDHHSESTHFENEMRSVNTEAWNAVQEMISVARDDNL